MQGTSCVETEPAKPKHCGTEKHKRDVRWLTVACRSLAATKENGSSKSCHTRRCMNYYTTGESDNTPL